MQKKKPQTQPNSETSGLNSFLIWGGFFLFSPPSLLSKVALGQVALWRCCTVKTSEAKDAPVPFPQASFNNIYINREGEREREILMTHIYAISGIEHCKKYLKILIVEKIKAY